MDTSNNKTSMLFKIVLLTLAGSFLYAINSAIRNNYGIMLNSIIANSGSSFTSVSFVLGVGQLVYGIAHPIFGAIALKKGNLFTLVVGSILTVIGVLIIPFCKSPMSLMLFLGILLPTGTGAISFGIIMACINPKIPKEASSMVSGIVNSSNGLGNILFSPIISTIIGIGGLMSGMIFLAVPSALMIPVSVLLAKEKKEKKIENNLIDKLDIEEDKTQENSMSDMFKTAIKNPVFVILVLGFFTCGFHMALITNHLPTQLDSLGFSSETVAYIFSVYGVATIVGSIIIGAVCSKKNKKTTLSLLYGLRTVIVLILLLLPKNLITACVFIFLAGFTGASTVPPVTGLLSEFFGAKNLGMFFGMVFLVHQIGSFFSAWLGGICFDMTGSYTIIWAVDILFCLGASLVTLKIKDRA